MEVVGPWRRQWAGAAEYGKVVDGVGGVVRTARALEVLQASGPGARVRVTRAAYHSSGPLSSSFLLHSSTRTILSSGVGMLRSPSLVSKPLELSSTPLDAASDSCAEGEEPYEVTEPDDADISEPSKWRSSLGRRSLRMPSEESSSTDNASLVDSSGRAYFATGSRRTNSSKTSTNSHSIRDAEHKALRSSFHRKPSGPLMKISEHAKCLESSVSKFPTSKPRDEWHDRRNSYGFENSPPNEIKMLSDDDKIGMESSTDSGICKSTEVVNIPIDKYKPNNVHDFDDVGQKADDRHETFQDWLAKNRSSSTPKPDISSTGIRDNSQINLKSPGKITISLPISSDKDSENNRESKYNNSLRGNHDNLDRKLKKVEFCKTELHFAAESGKVKIIETDEKPPSTNDFRRRRSAFVPIRDQLERPITLFGGTYLNESSTEQTYFGNNENGDITDRLNNEHDNDSAVKSILKNKIPKPKPYLLGEDIEFEKDRRSDDNIWGVRLTKTSDDFLDSNTTRSPISMLNESLKQDHRLRRKHIQEVDSKFNKSIITERNADKNYCNVDSKERKPSPADYVNLSDTHKKPQPLRSVASTQTSDDLIYDTVDKNHQRPVVHETQITGTSEKEQNDFNFTNFVHEKLKLLQLSPILQSRARTRHLRQNELSYFGITPDDTATKAKLSKTKPGREKPAEPATRRSRSVGRAYDSPVYQNLPINTLSPPVPAPRSSSSKLEKEVKESKRSDRNNAIDKYLSDESINNLSDTNDRETSTSRRKATRVLETINELKIATQGSARNSGSTNKDSKADPKHKPSRSSPNVVRVEATSRKSVKKNSTKESVTCSRESSLEDVGQPTPVQLCRSKKVDARGITKSHRGERESTSSIKKRENLIEDKIKHDVGDQKHGGRSTITSKATDSLVKMRSQTNPECSKEKSLQREHSNDKRSYSRKESEDSVRSPSKDKHSKHTEANVNEEVIRRRTSQTKPYEETTKQRSRKKEYVLNYDDKNGTLSSVNRAQPKHSNSRKHGEVSGTLGNIEEKPRESTRKSRVTTFQVKNPMLLTKDLHRRTKSADHTSPRRKPREEPSR